MPHSPSRSSPRRNSQTQQSGEVNDEPHREFFDADAHREDEGEEQQRQRPQRTLTLTRHDNNNNKNQHSRWTTLSHLTRDLERVRAERLRLESALPAMEAKRAHQHALRESRLESWRVRCEEAEKRVEGVERELLES